MTQMEAVECEKNIALSTDPHMRPQWYRSSHEGEKRGLGIWYTDRCRRIINPT
jgi:hypothetical protein